MLFKLSLSNIRRSLRDYAIYFFTLIIGVSVFYVFNAVDGQVVMTVVQSDTREIARILQQSMAAMSVFVAGVLGLLIVYASRFLMKRRNKEFALYMLLGMSKGKISLILLLETVLIGLGSLGVGLLLGIGLSQLMSALVVLLFKADMARYSFMVSGGAIANTVICFAVMYAVVVIFNSGSVSKMKLIDLMQSGKRSEKVKLKNPVLCVILFIIAAVGLVYAYYQVGWKYPELTAKKIGLYIAIGSVATFLIFWSVSGLLLRIVQSMKDSYYKCLNAFTFRQISSKINTMVMSMTVICLMLFVTICTLSASFSIRNSMNANLEELCPADFEIALYTGYNPDEEPFPFEKVSDFLGDNGYDMSEDLSEFKELSTYICDGVTYEQTLDESVKNSLPLLQLGTFEKFVRLSDYNSLARLYGKDELSLDEGQYAVLCNFKSMKEIRDAGLQKGTEIEIFGRTFKPKYSECQDGFIDISSSHINEGIYIVPDYAIPQTIPEEVYLIGNFKSDDKQTAERSVREKLDGAMRAATDKPYYYNGLMITSKIEISNDAVGFGAIATFIGLYVGLVFLIACGAILALKELSESVDSIGRYEMLRKIGAEESDISKSLFRQTGIFFLLPLMLAVVHSVFGMKFAVQVLEIFGTSKMYQSIALTSVILLLIYGGYFLITYFCSKWIIKDKR